MPYSEIINQIYEYILSTQDTNISYKYVESMLLYKKYVEFRILFSFQEKEKPTEFFLMCRDTEMNFLMYHFSAQSEEFDFGNELEEGDNFYINYSELYQYFNDLNINEHYKSSADNIMQYLSYIIPWHISKHIKNFPDSDMNDFDYDFISEIANDIDNDKTINSEVELIRENYGRITIDIYFTVNNI